LGSAIQFGQLRKKAPQIIAVAIALAIVAYLVFDFLDDVVIGGAPMTSEPVISIVLTITSGVTSTIQTWGYSGVFVLMLLESSSLPIPSEVILPFAGYLISLNLMNPWVTVTIATIAGILGAIIDYYIGLRGAQALIRHKILGKVLFSAAQLDTAQKWFDKHGSLMIFISRIIPGFRTTFSFPAGAAKMPLGKFIVFTTAGCLVWNGLLVYLGWYLGKNWKEVAGTARYLLIGSVIAIVIVIVVYLFWRRRNNKTSKNSK